MPDVEILAILTGTVAAFLISSVYYSAFGERLAEVSQASGYGEQPPPWKLAVELLRCLVLAAVVAGLASQGRIDELTGGLALGLALWLGFPAVLWTGAMIWEDSPRALAAIHAGDWLIKLLALGAIAAAWQ